MADNPDSDLEGRLPARRKERAPLHDWSLPLVDEPIKARMAEAVRLRQAEREHERTLPRSERVAFNEEREELRAVAFGRIFGWKPGAPFFVRALSPPDGKRACRCGCGRGCDRYPELRDRDAGLDHYEFYRQGSRPMAIVGQPDRPGFEYGKAKGIVAEVERERGIRITEVDPVLG